MFAPQSKTAARYAEMTRRPHHKGTDRSPADDVRESMRAAGVRPTRQRLALARLLFAKGHRHVSAETLFEEAQKAGVLVSLATVYNFLHTFTKRGLVRELFVDSGTVHYDTNTTDHCHFVSEIDGSIIDAPATGIYERAIAVVPEDLRVVDVQVILRLRPKGGYHAPAKVLRS